VAYKVMFTVSQNRPDSTKKARRQVAKSTYTGCPKSPEVVLRGYISETLGTTEMASAPKEASNLKFCLVF
jgi:hypothetical protein